MCCVTYLRRPRVSGGWPAPPTGTTGWNWTARPAATRRKKLRTVIFHPVLHSFELRFVHTKIGVYILARKQYPLPLTSTPIPIFIPRTPFTLLFCRLCIHFTILSFKFPLFSPLSSISFHIFLFLLFLLSIFLPQTALAVIEARKVSGDRRKTEVPRKIILERKHRRSLGKVRNFSSGTTVQTPKTVQIWKWNRFDAQSYRQEANIKVTSIFRCLDI